MTHDRIAAGENAAAVQSKGQIQQIESRAKMPPSKTQPKRASLVKSFNKNTLKEAEKGMFKNALTTLELCLLKLTHPIESTRGTHQSDIPQQL